MAGGVCDYLEKKPCGKCEFEQEVGVDYCNYCGKALSPDAKELAYDLAETKKVLLYPVEGDYNGSQA